MVIQWCLVDNRANRFGVQEVCGREKDLETPSENYNSGGRERDWEIDRKIESKREGKRERLIKLWSEKRKQEGFSSQAFQVIEIEFEPWVI